MTEQKPPPPPAEEADAIPDDLRTLFGRNLRAARCEQQLTQDQLGERAGMGKRYVSRVEDGQINITLDTMRRLASAIGIDVLTLLGGRAISPGDRIK